MLPINALNKARKLLVFLQESNRRMFDHYSSLGYNCEGAFQFRRVLGRDDSTFFSWNITSFEALESLLSSSFSGVMQVENFKRHSLDLVLDQSHGYMFHSMFPNIDDLSYFDYPEITLDHQRKAKYLIDKFVEKTRSDDRTAYFIKTEEEGVRVKSLRIRDLILKLNGGRHNFQIVIVQTADCTEEPWGDEMISNRYVRRFAAFDDAHDGHVSSWDRIFAEFPHRDGLRLAGY